MAVGQHAVLPSRWQYNNHYCCVCTGLCPDWQDWNPANNVDNATEAMDAAEQWLDVPQVQY